MAHVATTAVGDGRPLRDLPEPPKVPGPPLLGQSLKLAGDPERALRAMYDRFGPVFQFDAAHFNYIVLAGPDANEFVNGEGKDYFVSKPFWSSFASELNTPNTVIVLDGPAHQKVRRALKPALGRKVVEDNIPEVVNIVRDVFDRYKPGDDIPMVHVGQKLSSNIVGYLMADMIPSDAELKELFYYANNLTVLLAVLRLPRSVLKLRGPRYRRARAISHDLMERVVAKAVTQPHSRKLFIDTVLEARAKFPELFTDGDVKASGFLAFFAGIDTLGQTLTFMLWELLKHPEALARVQAEVDAVYAARNGVPTVDDIANGMPLCRAAFAETLRLHPTGFGIVRNAATDFEFNGYRVPAGRNILIYTTICHRMADYFPDPLAFDLDRYSEARQEDRQRGVYSPFGRGPHKCLGAAWADAQAILMLATILYHCQLELPAGMAQAKKRMRTTPTLGDDFRLRYVGRRN